MLGSGMRRTGGGELLCPVLGTDMLAEKEALTPEMLTVSFLFSDLFCAFISPRSLREKTCSISQLEKKKLPFNWAGQVTGSSPLALQCLREIKQQLRLWAVF